MATTSCTVNYLLIREMLSNIRDHGLDISINNILYGNSDFAYDVKCSLSTAVQRYILDTNKVV